MTSASWVLGVDSGGSGLRAALAPAHPEPDPGTGGSGDSGAAGLASRGPVRSSREPVRTGDHGIDAGHLMEQLAPMVRELLDSTDGGRLAAVAVGAAGMATLGGDLRQRLPAALDAAFGVRRLALAADGVTAYAGALGQRPGAAVAAGTGMIALGTDLKTWRRSDGWGHLLGDCGGGAWIGRAGLEAAMRAHDGRRGGSAALLERAEAAFDGPVTDLPGKLYPRADRPAVLASFAPEVARCAPHDPVAASLLRDAARHIAEAAVAVSPPGGECDVGLTGGLFRMGAPLLDPLTEELAVQLPAARVVHAAGDPLDGALALARALAGDALRLPHDGHLLHLPPDPDARP